MEARLSEIASVADQKERTAQYRDVVTECLAGGGNVEGLKAMVTHMMSDDVPLVISRQILQTLCQEVVTTLPAEQQKETAAFALEKMSPRVMSFDEQVSVLREGLSKLYQNDAEWSRAAKMLAGIDLDSGTRVLSDEYKLRKCVQIAMLYLEDDDAVNADTFIKKASFLLSACKDDTLEYQFKTCYARILDGKGRFVEAALRYYDLSQTKIGLVTGEGKQVGEADLAAALTNAITCAILAAAGPQRSRVLTTLYKDERCARLPVFSLMEKVYLERILRNDEVQAFSANLKPHQLGVESEDGMSIVSRAVIEHNLLSASKLYNNIMVTDLGQLLGVDPRLAEETAAKMIGEERMTGKIDQVDGLIYFQDPKDASAAMVQFDDQILDVCNQVNALIDLMDKKGILPEDA